MHYTAEQRSTHTVISPTGRLNMVTAPRLRQAVADVVAGGDSRVVIDLGDVDFMDSSGLGALVASLKTARGAGGDLRIAAVGTQVRMVLELTGLDAVLHPHDAVETAFSDD
jgi:anti-sigma B factor antagonist